MAPRFLRASHYEIYMLVTRRYASRARYATAACIAPASDAARCYAMLRAVYFIIASSECRCCC